MYILGISCGGESGAALFNVNKLCCASNEERFSRIKLDTSFPVQAISWCLQHEGIKSEDIELITYGFSSGCETQQQKQEWIQTLLNIDNSTPSGQIISDRILIETKIDHDKYTDFEQEVNKYFKRNIPIHRVNHHMSHIAAAYYPSGMEEALIITADGRGDYRSLSIGIATHDGFQELYVAPSWYSLGYFYGRLTKLCGFTANRHEGKVTGLAAHGDPTQALEFVKKMIWVSNGKIEADIGDYYRPFFTNYSKALIDEANQFKPEDLAAATQHYFEMIFIELISYYINKTGINNIALAGGVFSNISLNQAIYEISDNTEVFIYPNMGDAGICVGSCYAWLWLEQKYTPEILKTMYLGYNITPSQMYKTLILKNCKVHSSENIYQDLAEILLQGNTIGLAQDQAEFGPRALGNRSILASPQNLNILIKINKQLGRDSFMPLAPMIPIELAQEYVIFKKQTSIHNGYFMTMTYQAKPNLQKVAEAIVHIDGTIRPQFVTKESNPFVHGLLMYWYEKTGCPALINTSFNAHEEPIVNNEYDVISALIKGVVDVVVTPPYIAYK